MHPSCHPRLCRVEKRGMAAPCVTRRGPGRSSWSYCDSGNGTAWQGFWKHHNHLKTDFCILLWESSTFEYVQPFLGFVWMCFLLIIFWGPRLWVLNFRSGRNMPGEDAAADKPEELAVPQPSEVGRQTGRDLEKQTLQNHLPHSPELQNQSGQVFHWTKRVLLRILWYSVSLSGSSFDFFFINGF